MPRESLEELVAAARREAEAAEFPVDEPVYRKNGRDPIEPVLFAGSVEAALGIMGRDLGKDEVAAGQPLIGAAGRLVRLGVLRAWGETEETAESGAGSVSGPPLQAALKYVLLTNTVPYKPPGNKAYPETIRRRFRPFVERLLADHWTGRHLITLGTEAFGWFAPYIDADLLAERGKGDVRFESSFPCLLPTHGGTDGHPRAMTVFPLPHPSPLNRRWYDRFPSMLADRLAEIRGLLKVTSAGQGAWVDAV
ncbi:MAG: uracil-DNA glycosylase family protein [Isosphaeraceae bacterium]